MRIGCAWERLGGILRDHGRVGWLFGRSGGGLCLVAAHGEFVERRARKEVVRWWRAKVRISRKGAELNMVRAKDSLSGRERREEREKGKGRREREESERARTAYLGCGSFGISRSRRRSDSAGGGGLLRLNSTRAKPHRHTTAPLLVASDCAVCALFRGDYYAGEEAVEGRTDEDDVVEWEG